MPENPERHEHREDVGAESQALEQDCIWSYCPTKPYCVLEMIFPRLLFFFQFKNLSCCPFFPGSMSDLSLFHTQLVSGA